MKKAFLIAFAALCAFAAQAVTVGWEKYGTGLAAGSYALDPSKTADGITVALVVDFDASEATTEKLNGILCLLSDSYVGSMSTGLSSGVYNAWTSYSTNGSVPGGFGTKRGNTNFNIGKNVFGISIYEGTSATDGNSGVFIDYFVNGVLLEGDTTRIKWTAASNPPQISNLDEFVIGANATGADVYVMYGKATTADYATVPEPTALALLALGVAGLALKRKLA